MWVRFTNYSINNLGTLLNIFIFQKIVDKPSDSFAINVFGAT